MSDLNDVIVSGEPYIVAFVFKIDESTPLDISDFTALIELRKLSKNGELVDSWADGDVELSRDDLAGTVALTLPPEYTRALRLPPTYLDCLITSVDSGVRSPAIKLTLDLGVTR